MLAKVVKKETAENLIIPFSIPEVGIGRKDTEGVSPFVFSDISTAFSLRPLAEETEHDEIDEFDAERGQIVMPKVQEILQNARDEAEQIIAEAEEQSAIMAEAARDRLTSEIRQDLEAEMNLKVNEIREDFIATIQQVSSLSGQIIAQSETEMVKLALEIAKKIVGREVTIDREVALTLVKIALAKLHNRTFAKVLLNPEDFAYMQSHLEKADFHGSIELVEDRSISLGGCLIQTETGEIDARIESQFDEIAYGLLKG
jgi:flagellar assembly protein FliH